jgi:hypothetical protein
MQATLDMWYADRPEVLEWQQKTVAYAREHGMPLLLPTFYARRQVSRSSHLQVRLVRYWGATGTFLISNLQYYHTVDMLSEPYVHIHCPHFSNQLFTAGNQHPYSGRRRRYCNGGNVEDVEKCAFKGAGVATAVAGDECHCCKTQLIDYFM